MKAILCGLVSIGLLVSCTKTQKEDYSQELVKPLSGEQVILEYKGGKITARDVEAQMKPQFERLREQLLNAYIKSAEDVLVEREAEKFKVSGGNVTEAELENYMKANKIPKTETEKIKAFLASEKSRIQKQINKMQVFKELDVQNKLGAARYDVQATSGMPSQGTSSAAVTVQVFCDFGNPMCNRSRLVMGEIKNQFGDKVRWVYRHFPVPSNPIGADAALVAICAQMQDVFWPVHDRLYDHQAELTKENLLKIAGAAGANNKKLEDCLKSSEAQELLNKEIKDAEALGLTQTPAYFVNGTKINEIDQLKPFIASQIGKK